MLTNRRTPLFALALLLFGLLAPLQIFAQEAAAPKAVVPTTVVDLGKHPRGSKVETKFVIQNQGTGPLMIIDTASSCSCMIVKFDAVIAPGASGEIVAMVDTEVLEGPSRTSATVLTNDPENPRISLEVKLESEPYLAAKPGFFHYTVHQGFEGDSAIAQTVLATNPPEFTIERVEATDPSLSVEFREATPEERISGFEGPQYRIIGKLDKMAAVGPLTGFVRVYTTHEKQKLFSIPVSGFVRPVVAVTPPRMDLGTFSIAEDQERLAFTVRVQHFLAAAADLQITKIESDLANLETRVSEGNTDHDWWLELWWKKELAPTGKFKGTVKIHTTSQLAPIVELEVEGERV